MMKKRKDRHGAANPFFGKHHSDETKRKMAEYHWWNNGVESVFAKTCPSGFHKGRTSHPIKVVLRVKDVMKVDVPAAAPHKPVQHPDNDLPPDLPSTVEPAPATVRCLTRAAQHPANDIPAAPALSREKHWSKVIPRLQEFVNKCYISKREADRLALIAKEKITTKESRTGFSYQDRQKNIHAREIIMRHFVSEYQRFMSSKDWKWAREFTR